MPGGASDPNGVNNLTKMLYTAMIMARRCLVDQIGDGVFYQMVSDYRLQRH